MSDASRNSVWARAFMEELARAGVTDVCLAPGSRSAPLVLAAARQGRLRVRVFLDERSAAFFALGLGKAGGRPAAVVTTSGTAAANLLPAVVEASQAETPLLLLTADRPHRLRDSDANQAIDQVRLFGGYVRAFFEVAPPVVRGPELRHLRGLAARAVAAAVGLPAGPVHLNFPFDKPLEPVAVEGDVPAGFAEEHPRAWRGREGERPFVRVGRRRPVPSGEEMDALVELVEGSPRGVIVAGPSPEPDRLGDAVLRAAAATGFPVLADPLSGARFHPAGATVVSGAYDLFLRHGEIAARLAPELVLRVGQSPTSAALLRWLEEQAEARQVVIDPGERWKDHLAVATDYLRADPAEALERLTERVKHRGFDAWRILWRRVEERAREVAREHLGRSFFEGSVAAEVVGAIPAGGTLFVSSSMPVRDLDAFAPPREEPVRVLGNRGASGIDGVVSTALGASAASGRPLVALLGDLALLHDVNGLLATREPDAGVVFVVIHNDGGGIFHLLPIREYEPEFTRFFATPHGLDLSHAAALYGVPYERTDGREAFTLALRAALGEAASGRSRIVEVASDGEENRRAHEAVHAAVGEALDETFVEGARG